MPPASAHCLLPPTNGKKQVYNDGVVRVGLIIVFAIGTATTVLGYPSYTEMFDDIPDLVSRSTLACKGEVVYAPEVMIVDNPKDQVATATVSMDRCFKGHAQVVRVVFDAFTTGGGHSGGPLFRLTTGDHDLFFLKLQGDNFVAVNNRSGALPISRKMGPSAEGSDSLTQLELDFKAGLNDPDPELVLASICLLGAIKHLHSTSELLALLDSADLLQKTYLWEALLKLKTYSVLPAVAKFFADQPDPPIELFLPRDRVFAMEHRLFHQVSRIQDASALAYLQQFALAPNPRLRMNALQALRSIEDPRTAPTFLKALEDDDSDNAFSAMQGLFALAGGGEIDWVPNWEEFKDDQPFYAAKCREWWQAEGRQKTRARFSKWVRPAGATRR